MKKRSLISLLLVSLLIALLVSGCTQQTPEADKQPAEPQKTSIKIGGSSTLAPIVAKCADNFTEEFKTWNKVDASLPEEPIVIFVSTGGSGFGLKSAQDGTFDIGLVSKSLKDDEKAPFAQGEIVQIGSDVLDIAVNPQNPAAKVKPNLTSAELKDIFSGKITSWKQLDPKLPDKEIVVAVRDIGGGASEVFDKAVMKGTPISPKAQQIPSMGALAAKIMDNADVIGYVSSGLVNQNPDKLVPISVDGVAPTLDNIKSGRYIIGRPLLVLSKDKFDIREKLFVDYLSSEKGQAVVEEMGYIKAAK
ncbi:phosphate ABC transporter substrate-binding protein [Syntrophomonas palmitatica]|uniref:phosphate ABC transporter substrate-binding protein n=1 Tax=Syntrophomonas palmitatica TaxID=402877 RepID=UPI0006D1D783|nr:phosphate ABC transporter substrate-binding protein [Syntrophomonas palmitatica]